MELYLIVLLVVSLIAGMTIIYLFRYWRKAGQKLGLWKMMILLLLMTTCQAQDLPPDLEPYQDDHPVVFPDQMEQATDIMMDVASDILGEELAWQLGIRAFLENNSTALNYTEFRA